MAENLKQSGNIIIFVEVNFLWNIYCDLYFADKTKKEETGRSSVSSFLKSLSGKGDNSNSLGEFCKKQK